jgi:hypothetical protein
VPTRETHPGPDRKPAYSSLLVDDEDNLWVKRYQSSLMADLVTEDPSRWWVFDDRRRWLGEVTFPPRFDLTSIQQNFAVGIKRDELDVPSVQVLAIRKGPPL